MTDAELSEAVRLALRAKYPPPDRGQVRTLLLEEVRNGTGFGASTRYADALGFNFWPSDGHTITGYEIKVSRADWLRELKDPEKSFAFARYCDFWTVIAGRDGIVAVDELPPHWGLQVLNAKGKLHTVRAPQKLPAEPMSRALLMAIVRTACTSAFGPIVAAAVESTKQQMLREQESLERIARDRLRRLEERVKAFEDASGISLGNEYSYEDPKRLGAIVRAVRGVLGNGYDGALSTIEGHARTLRKLAEQCDAASAEVRALQAAEQPIAAEASV